MKVELTLVPYEEKTVLYNLMQLYRYDSSEFDGHALNDHGLYVYKYLDHYWTDEHRRPFMVKVDGELAGLALVSLDRPPEQMMLSQAERTHTVNEFFIMRKFRGRGAGREAACSLFDQIRGTWEVRQTYANKSAHAFWQRVIAQYTAGGGYEEKLLHDERWHGPVFVFRSMGD